MIYINKYKIIWSPKANKDLQNIYKYIAYHLKENATANNVIKEIMNSISCLNYSPERYLKISNYTDKMRNLRRLPINKYIVIYEINNNTRTSLYLTYLSWKSKLFKSFIII